MKWTMRNWRQLLLALLAGAAMGTASAVDEGSDTSTTVEKEIQHFVVNADGSFVESSDVVIVINEGRAVGSGAQRRISFDRSIETLDVIVAYTQKADGSQLPVELDKIKEQQDRRSASAPMFHDTQVKVIIFPNVTVGDRLVYQTRRTRTVPTFARQFDDISAPDFTPIKQFALIYDLPSQMVLHADNLGFTASLPPAESGRTVYRWDYVSVPNQRVENGSVGWRDYRPHVYVSTFANYAEFARAFEAGTRDKSEVTPAIAKLARQVSANVKGARAQAYALDNWVRRNIRYVHVPVGGANRIPHRAETVLSNRYADSNDHVALLRALLRAVGIDSSAALLNASTMYSWPTVPNLDVLYHAITYIPSLDLYLDSSAETVLPGYLYNNELDKSTLLIASATIGHTPRVQRDASNSVSQFSIAADGAATFRSKVDYDGFGAEGRRAEWRNTAPDARRSMVERILRARGQSGEGEIVASATEGSADHFGATYSGRSENWADLPGPIGIPADSALRSAISGHVAALLSETERTQDYVCASAQADESARYLLAKEISVLALPKPLTLHNQDFDYEARYVREGDAILVQRHFASHHAGRVCTPDDFKRMQPSIEAMTRDLRSQLILRVL